MPLGLWCAAPSGRPGCAGGGSGGRCFFCCLPLRSSVVFMGELHPDVPGEALQEQHGEEYVVMLFSRAQLPHVSQEFGRLPAAKGLHGVEELHPLKVSQLVAGKQGILQLGVGLLGVGCDNQMDHLLQRHLIQGSGHVTEPIIQ